MKEGQFIFVHSTLDEAGLSPRAFRVLAHIARRSYESTHWAAVSNMAGVCGMDEKTVKGALRELLERRMITRQSRHGQTSIYTLAPMTLWTQAEKRPRPKNDPGQIPGHHPGQKTAHDLGQKTAHKGNPIRKSHKEIPSSPSGESGGELFDGKITEFKNPHSAAENEKPGRHHAITSRIGEVYREVTGENFSFAKKFTKALSDFLAGWDGTADEFLDRYRDALELRGDQFAGQCRRASDPVFLCQNWQVVGAEIKSFTKPAAPQRRTTPMRNTV